MGDKIMEDDHEEHERTLTTRGGPPPLVVVAAAAKTSRQQGQRLDRRGQRLTMKKPRGEGRVAWVFVCMLVMVGPVFFLSVAYFDELFGHYRDAFSIDFLPALLAGRGGVEITSTSRTSTAIQNRKVCLDRIRRRHRDSFAPFFSGAKHPTGGVSETNPLLLVDPAYHPNFGDTLLLYAEHTFLQRTWEEVDAEDSASRRTTQSPPLNANATTSAIGTGSSEMPPSSMVIRECWYAQAKSMTGEMVGCAKWLGDQTNKEDSTAMRRLSIWQAGGNWGDLYAFIQKARISSFQHLIEANYSVLGMPQSLFYNNKKRQSSDALQIKDNIARGLGLLIPEDDKKNKNKNTGSTKETKASLLHPLDTPEGQAIAQSRVILTWRELSSYEEGLQLYPFVKNILIPDIAFQEGPFWDDPRFEPSNHQNLTVDVLFFLRADQESKWMGFRKNQTSLGLLLNQEQSHSQHDVDKKKLTFRVVEWQSRSPLFNNNDMRSLETAVQLLKLGRVMICDRLHAAILAYVSGVPFVYLDQSTNKVTKTLSVAFAPYNETKSPGGHDDHDDDHDCMDGHQHMWAKATGMEDAIAKALQMIDVFNL